MESSRRRLLIGGLATLLAAQCLYGILTLATLYKSYKTSLVSVPVSYTPLDVYKRQPWFLFPPPG